MVTFVALGIVLLLGTKLEYSRRDEAGHILYHYAMAAFRDQRPMTSAGDCNNYRPLAYINLEFLYHKIR